jgi:hypothetical protein
MKRAVLLFAVLAVGALPAAASATSVSIPPPHCDPAACPNPVEGVSECVDNAITAVRYIVQGTPQPQECHPLRP